MGESGALGQQERRGRPTFLRVVGEDVGSR
jgi:hypothetical protein